jgi:hypothetical protein
MPDDGRARPARGRPAVSRGEASTAICVKVGGTDFQRVYQLAQQQRTSMPAIVRQALTRLLDDEADD